MIYSMTGFGRGISSSPTFRYTIDIKSLNSKQLDLTLRLPTLLKELEAEVRTMVSSKLERGKIEVSVNCEFIGAEEPVKLNVPVISGYKSQIEEMSKALNIPEPEDWFGVLLRLPDTFKSHSTEIEEEDKKAFQEGFSAALNALIDFRRSEGLKLYEFFKEKIDKIKSLLSQVAPFEQERIPKIKEKLEEHLAHLQNIEYDSGRLEQELIFYIEKLDITEEKTRLNAHLNYFLETLGAEKDSNFTQGQGKKLGFIAQEMGREINTLGSKSNHSGLQKLVVMMKDELEQIKEQVLNVL